MDRYRLKNVIILILLLVNVFLLGSLAYRDSAAQSAQDRALQQLTALFAADGIELDPAVVSSRTPPAGHTLTRDTALERSAAAQLLGSGLVYTERWGVYSYTGNNGTVLFRDNGSFDAAGTLAPSDGAAFCESFCKKFHYEILSSQLDGEGSGAILAARKYDRLPVYNCTVTFTLDRGAVTSASGTLLPDVSTELSGEEPLSAQGALIAFQSMRRETGAVASSIEEVSLCYELQSSIAAPMSLTPAWCIVTNTLRYYVNCHTGAVSQS